MIAAAHACESLMASPSTSNHTAPDVNSQIATPRVPSISGDAQTADLLFTPSVLPSLPYAPPALSLRCPTILATPLLLPSSRASHLTCLLPCTPHDADPPDALTYPFLLSLLAPISPPPPCPPSHVLAPLHARPSSLGCVSPPSLPLPSSMYHRRHSSSTLRVVSHLAYSALAGRLVSVFIIPGPRSAPLP
ncbi:hypothetical protein C8R44DRAFT_993052 [Mycena epipterygia]|nr:hypothetical protein C8R44DRAFT_993052 [Mycena epipterygia]